MQQIGLDDFTLDKTQGLKAQQVLEMRARYGRNEFTPPKSVPWWHELLAKFNDPTIKILLAAAFISLAVTAIERHFLSNEGAGYIETIGIFFAVLLATLVGYFSERRSRKEFELLNRVKEDIPIKVLRDSQIVTIPIGEIVAGDLVRVESGDKIPADGILLEAGNLLIDQSMLTGESIPARKLPHSEPIDWKRDRRRFSANDEVFLGRGTMVADGHGLFLVTAVGDETGMGAIARALADESHEENETPLTAKLAVLARQISVVGIICALSIFTIMAISALIQSDLDTLIFQKKVVCTALAALSVLLGAIVTRWAFKPFLASIGLNLQSGKLLLLSSIPWIIVLFTILTAVWGCFSTPEEGVELLRKIILGFVVAVTIIVVAVPEGLPMMVTVSLALNMMKMARQNCLIRKLVASETIGSATVICTDKTGTLTENKMKPVWIFAEGSDRESDRFNQLTQSAIWPYLANGIAVNSEANLRYEQTETKEKRVTGIGNPTESALLKFLDANGTQYLSIREKNTILFELGHNSERKMSVVLAERDGVRRCYMKGAPERIVPMCTDQLGPDGLQSLDEQGQLAINGAIGRAADRALRVLGFSEKIIDNSNCCCCMNEESGTTDPATACRNCTGRTFVGLVGIADPIRPGVAAAVNTCHEAGIEVKMITGDALNTASAIARQAGIYTDAPDEIVMTSADLAKISDEELPKIAKHLKVLARSTPSDKLRLVKALHEDGEVVAMTGDGTNDAPALKFADVGLSMGITGTEVAKEACDIVLVDDNFESIVTGVWWGRTLFQNIQRFLQFQLSVNLVALLCALLGPLTGVPLPLTVTQLLWINVIMDTFAAIALSMEPPRHYTMKAKPIAKNAHIITGTMAITILIVSTYQVLILFAALFGGWFVEANEVYNRTIPATDPNYLKHNLEALTVFFTILIMFQFWHKINCRALEYNESPFALLLKNRTFLIIISTITVVQIAMVQMPQLEKLFRTTPLSLHQWLSIFVLTATVIPVAWLGRLLAHRFFFHEKRKEQID